MAQVGFIGAGNMGLPMLKNVLAAGHSVRVFDVAEPNLAAAEAAGATPAASASAAAGGVDAVITVLPAGKQVRDVYLGEGGALSSANPRTVFMDCSTIDVATAREVAAAAAEAGHYFVDAPMSGGTVGAEAGTLTFMVGGEDASVAKSEPFLQAMGKSIVPCGGPGNGQAAKICNNMILGVTMIGVSEAFVLAESLGLSHQQLFDVSSKSSGQCWSLTTYCPVPGPVPTSPANRDYTPGFSAAMMLKDLRLAQDAAGDGAKTPLGAAAARLYESFAAASGGDADFSGIIRYLRQGKSA